MCYSPAVEMIGG